MKTLSFVLLLLTIGSYAFCMEKKIVVAAATEQEKEAFVRNARRGEIDAIKAFVSANKGLINIKKGRNERTALHTAAMGYLIDSNVRCFEIFNFLLQSNANPENTDSDNLTVKQFIQKKAQRRPVQWIADRAANLIGLIDKTLTGTVQHKLAPMQPQDLFCQHAHRGDVAKFNEMFFSKQTNLLNMQRTDDEKTALHCAAMGYLIRGDSQCITIFSALLAAGADFSIKARGQTVRNLIEHKSTKYKDSEKVLGIENRAVTLLEILQRYE